MRFFHKSVSEELAAYDSALASSLRATLVTTLRDELDRAECEALELAGEVLWTVTREKDGLWLGLTHDHSGSSLGVGGDWRRNKGLLTLYVRQMAYGSLLDGEASTSHSRRADARTT